MVKDILKKQIVSNIEKWTDEDIYAISLFVYDENDNPCKPTVTLGYNTEMQVKKEIANASDEQEARWNYAFWLQNNFLCFGIGETAKDVMNWLESNRFPYYEDDDKVWDNNEIYENLEVITKMFVKELICVVKEIHQSGLLTLKYGKEIPIIIHELEYYDEIAEQNIEANGKNLVANFLDFCMM